MKTTYSSRVTGGPRARRFTVLATAASLLLGSSLHAQTPDPVKQGEAAPRIQPPADNLPLNHPLRAKLHTMKFAGGSMSDLRDSLGAMFPDDNVVLSDSVSRMELPEFEIRNVLPEEIGRTIEFLSEGQVRVEVDPTVLEGRFWRIGRVNTAEAAATVKMRSVAAPSLFADEKALAGILEASRMMEMQRIKMTGIIGGPAAGFDGATAQPLKDQNLFIIIGDEEGVAGLENLIKAAEQQLAEASAAKAASIAANAPEMRAVLAPHVFAEEGRWRRLMEEMKAMHDNWMALNEDLQLRAGSPALGFTGLDFTAHEEQKVFVLMGAEAAIAGMESLIKAAEQLAMEGDAKLKAELKAAEDRTKDDPNEQ